MRTFTDDLGTSWDVMVGRESWGTLVLLFARRDGSDTRQHVLAAETPAAAEHEVDALTDEELRARLATATPWGG